MPQTVNVRISNYFQMTSYMNTCVSNMRADQSLQIEIQLQLQLQIRISKYFEYVLKITTGIRDSKRTRRRERERERANVLETACGSQYTDIQKHIHISVYIYKYIYVFIYMLYRKRKSSSQYIYTHTHTYTYARGFYIQRRVFDFEIISRILKITHSSKVRVVSVVVVVVVFVFVLHIGYIATVYRIVSNAISLQSRNSCLLEHNVEKSSNCR